MKFIKNKNNNWFKKGFVSIEIVILFSLLLCGGVLSVNNVFEGGFKLTNGAQGFTDELIQVGDRVTGPIHITGDGSSILKPPVDDVIVDPPTAGEDDEDDGIIHVSSVIVQPTYLELFIGESSTISYVIQPNNAANKQVAFQSDNNKIATVSQLGRVTGIAEGGTTIYVYSLDNGRFGSVGVNVKPILSEDLQVSPSSLLLKVGESKQLTAKILPENTTNKNITYTSHNPAIATVDEKGVVTAVHATPDNNKTTIVVSDGRHEKLIPVEVIGNIVETTEIELNRTSVTIEKGETFQVVAQLIPAGATIQEIVYSSTDSMVATVNETGLITGNNIGTAIVKVSNFGGDFYGKEITNSIIVTVIDKAIYPDRIGLSYNSDMMSTGDQMDAMVTFFPENTTHKGVKFTSSNPSAVTVDADGKVTAVGIGEATIRVESLQNPQIYAEFIISAHGEVIRVTGVSVSPENVTLEKLDTVRLETTIYPFDATNKSVIYSSSDESVARVSQDGVVTAINYGTAEITITTIDGGFKTKSIISVPYIPVEEIKVEPSSVRLGISETRELTIEVLPSNATNKEYTFGISDGNVFRMAGNTIVPVNYGSAVLTIESVDGFKVDVLVEVVRTSPSSIELDKTNINIFRGEREDVMATVLPELAENRLVNFISADPRIATVESVDGVHATIRGIANGSTTITVVAQGNPEVTAEISVNVNPVLPETMIADPSRIYLEVDEMLTVNRTIYPVTADNKDISCQIVKDPTIEDIFDNDGNWVNDPTGYLALEAEGVAEGEEIRQTNCKVKAIGAGTGILVMRSLANPQLFVEVPFEVVADKNPVTGLETSDVLNITLNRGQTFQTNVRVIPDSTKYPELDYISNNSTVATVNSTGLITGVTGGTTQVVVTSYYGHTLTYNVTVRTIEVTDVVVKPSNRIWMMVGEKTNWQVELLPTNHDEVFYNTSVNGQIDSFKLDTFESTVEAIKGGTIYLSFNVSQTNDVGANLEIRSFAPVCKWSNWESADDRAIAWLEERSEANQLVYETKTVAGTDRMFRYRDIDRKCWGEWSPWADYTEDLKPKVEYFMEEGIKDCRFQLSPRAIWDEWSGWEVYDKDKHTPSGDRQVEEKQQSQQNFLVETPQYLKYIYNWSGWSTTKPSEAGTLPGDIESRPEYGYQNVTAWGNWSVTNPNTLHQLAKLQYRSNGVSWGDWVASQNPKNKFIANKSSKFDEKGTMTVSGSGTITIDNAYAMLTSGKTYTASFVTDPNVLNTGIKLYLQNGSNRIALTSNKTTFTAPSTANYSLVVEFVKTNTPYKVWDVQVEEGNNVTAFELTKIQYGYQTVATWNEDWSTTKPEIWYRSKLQYHLLPYTWSAWQLTVPNVPAGESESGQHYTYKEVTAWSTNYQLTKPADGYYKEVTQYGYQTVATWSNNWSTTMPTDGYYTSKLQYRSKGFTWSPWQDTKPNLPADEISSEMQYRQRTYSTWSNWSTASTGILGEKSRKEYRQNTYSWSNWLASMDNVDGNVLANSTFGVYNEVSKVCDWDVNLHSNLVPTNWSSGCNMGVANPTIDYHAYLQTKKFEYPVFEFNSTRSTRWLGIAQTIPSSKLTAGREYDITMEIYSEVAGGHINGGFYHRKNGGTSHVFTGAQYSFTIAANETNKWVTKTATLTLPADVDLSQSVSLYVYGNNGTQGIKYVRYVSVTPKGETAKVSTDLQSKVQYGYRAVASWTGFTTTKPTGPHYISKEQYSERKFTWSDWSTTIPNVPSSQMKTGTQYRMQSYSSWSAWSTSATGTRGELSKKQYRAKGFAWSDWSTTINNNAPAADREQATQYRQRTYSTWSGWSTSQSGILGEVSKLQYQTNGFTWSNWSTSDTGGIPAEDKQTTTMYSYRDVTSWESVYYGTPQGSFYRASSGYANYSATGWSGWSRTNPSSVYKESRTSYEWLYSSRSGSSGNAAHANYITDVGGAIYTDINWKIYEMFIDIDTCTSSWTNYASPGVKFFCHNNGWREVAYYGPTNSANNNPIAHLGDINCDVVTMHSTGNNGSGRNRTFWGAPIVKFKYQSAFTEYRYVTAWSAPSYSATCHGNGGSLRCDSTTVYQKPATWGGWSSWQTGAVGQTTSREVRTTTGYRYKIWGAYGAWADCPSSGCPTSTANNKVNTRRVYSYPNWTGWSDWTLQSGTLPSTSIGGYGSTGRQVETRTVYRYKVWQNYGSWQDCPNNNCPSTSSTQQVETRTVYSYPIWGTMGGWTICPSTGCPSTSSYVYGQAGQYVETRAVYSYKIWSNESTGNWIDCPTTGCPADTDTYKYTRRTVYATPATWGEATGWRDSGKYEVAYNRKPVTRMVYRYKIWGAFGSWTECPNGVCPSTTTENKVQTRTTYSYPIWSDWGAWTSCGSSCPTTSIGGTTGKEIQTKQVWRYKIWGAFGSWADCPNGTCPTTNYNQIIETRTVYAPPATWNAATGWRESGPYTKTPNTKPVTRLVYYLPTAWSDYKEWSLTTPYTQTPSRMPLTVTRYRYKVWGTASGNNWVDCPSSGCPTNSGGNRYITRTVYSTPKTWNTAIGWNDDDIYVNKPDTKKVSRYVVKTKNYSQGLEWVFCPEDGCPTSTPELSIEVRTVYGTPTAWSEIKGWRPDTPYAQNFETKAVTRTTWRHKVWTVTGTWVDCPNGVCPTNDANNRYDYRTIYVDHGILGPWVDCPNGVCPEDTQTIIYNKRTVYRYRVLLTYDQLEYSCRDNINIPIIVDEAIPKVGSSFTIDGITYLVTDDTVNDGDGFEVTITGYSGNHTSLNIDEVVHYQGSNPTAVFRITKIQTGAFKDCNNLVSITGAYVQTIESRAFQNCANLSDLLFERLVNLADDAFVNCPNIE